MNKVLYIILISFFTGCSLNYDDAILSESLSEDIPNTILYQYESVEIKNASPILRIIAEKAEVYESKEETRLSNVDFFNFKDSEVNNYGSADFAILNMKSKDANLKGSIEIESIEEESFLKAETLLWNDSEKLLSSEQDDYVIVKDKKNSTIRGRGFSADLKRKSIIFSGKTEGEYISDEN